MTTVKIGTEERLLRNADPQWIERQINGRRHDELNVCVVVVVTAEDVDIRLTTPTCSAARGGYRPLTPREEAIAGLWKRCGLADMNFSAGSLIAFVKQLPRLLR